jgi:hypothetical protein
VTIDTSSPTIRISAHTSGGFALPFTGTLSTDGALLTLRNPNADGGGLDVTVGSASGEFSHPTNAAVFGDSNNGYGVVGTTSGTSYVSGVSGTATSLNATGVYAQHKGDGIALQAIARGSGFGIAATSEGGVAISAECGADAIEGASTGGGYSAGIRGSNSSSGVGVYGLTANAAAYAVYGNSNDLGFAGYFDGDVHINGNTEILGTITNAVGAVKLDDPSDPENKYLYHSSVQSPDMKNIYDGVATLGPSGAAKIVLPRWFDSLNRDFRYQLTALGTPQAGLFISKEIENNEFTIAGGVPGARVSWMVTGIRRDPWAEAHRIPVEQVKPVNEQGTYLDPTVYGQPEKRSLRAAQERSRAAVAPESP